jgi:hypothetical protein
VGTVNAKNKGITKRKIYEPNCVGYGAELFAKDNQRI